MCLVVPKSVAKFGSRFTAAERSTLFSGSTLPCGIKDMSQQYSLSLSLSLHFNGHFSRWIWFSQYQNVSNLDFIGAKVGRGGGDNWSYKSNRNHQQTNTQLFTGWMPFLSPKQQCQNTEGS